MTLQFDNVRYRKRQLVENRFSVLKRKFSGDLKARILATQKKEIAGKMIVCNIHRFFSISYFLSEPVPFNNQVFLYCPEGLRNTYTLREMVLRSC
jgi:hypothetical protein